MGVSAGRSIDRPSPDRVLARRHSRGNETTPWRAMDRSTAARYVVQDVTGLRSAPTRAAPGRPNSLAQTTAHAANANRGPCSTTSAAVTIRRVDLLTTSSVGLSHLNTCDRHSLGGNPSILDMVAGMCPAARLAAACWTGTWRCRGRGHIGAGFDEAREGRVPVGSAASGDDLRRTLIRRQCVPLFRFNTRAGCRHDFE